MLRKLEIYALRGATEKFVLPFERGKRITILYGENGSGKTTICDSLELLAEKRVGSLDNKGLGRTESYWHAAGKTPAELSVLLETTQGQWQAKLVKKNVVVTPEHGCPRVKVLRRNQLLQLIATEAGKRYQAIRPFIDISGVEASEGSLRNLVRAEKRNLEVATARLDENRAALERFWQLAGSPGASALTWAQSELAKDAADVDEELSQLERLSDGCAKLSSEHRQREEMKAQLTAAEAELAVANESVAQEQAQALNTSGELVALLQAAAHYFHQHGEAAVCPLCESPQFAQELPTQVESKLASIQSLSDALRRQADAQRSVETAARQVANQQEKEQLAAAHLSGLIAQRTVLSDLALPGTTTEAELVERVALLQSATQEELNQRREQKGFLQSLRAAVAGHNENYAAQQQRSLLIPKLEEALAEVEQVRRQFVDDLLSEIANRVGELYEKVHPDEGLSKISLLLDPDKRASLEIHGRFLESEAVPPGAYFSEAHLDTLGLCIWLALAEREDPTRTILVLDDVVASIDERHVERVILLLHSLAHQFQHCLVTTHYRPLREKYRLGQIEKASCHFVDLLDWHPRTGIRWGENLPPLEELRHLLDATPPPMQDICAKAGVILESILDFITLTYQCRAPRGKKLDIGDLLNSPNKELLAALRVERREPNENESMAYRSHALGPMLQTLKTTYQIRNLAGCHYNELAQHFPLTDAINFGQQVYELGNLLVDAAHGWPKSDKSGSYWANAKETVRLYPLKHPR